MSQENKSGGLFGFFRKGGEEVESNVPLSEEVIRQWLVKRLAKQVKVDPSAIDTAKKFELYGLDSIVAVRVSGDLEKLVEQRLSPALLFEHPSIDELSAHLATELGLNAIA
ncbi:phosphopantetheine attachment site family protein [Collimonas fungivorans]|uniref:Phosphopantetheine-binding protein n=2 Tax=Collimonas fungivorans TaxID=158899 RepID=G0AIY0_COLFT|nr:acyl carrier protein [Collimonas fungivorans]AEK60913.1 phosphopantetheine-binding protein [Collimonas fungivorans Ter331]AMO92774.1 phosphopantetheine attachment site family protein [Collimonas fungivorans]MDB5768057.1 pksP [Collimonas fungivorans]